MLGKAPFFSLSFQVEQVQEQVLSPSFLLLLQAEEEVEELQPMLVNEQASVGTD